jgi:hypothetical protein
MSIKQTDNTFVEGNDSDTDVVVQSSHEMPIRVQMLGGSGVGKTCFLAGLALLGEQSDGQTFVVPLDSKTTAIFDNLRGTLASGRWPAKTSIVDEVNFAIQQGGQRVNVVLTDFAGEAFSDAMQRGSENEAAGQVQDMVSQSDVLLVLLDGAAVDAKKDFCGAPLIKAVFERMDSHDNKEMEVAVVLTKRDLCVQTPVSNAEDLKKLVETQVADLARYLKEQSIRTHWIPVSVCGTNAVDEKGAPIYADLAPEGYETIFRALFARRSRPRKRRVGIVASCVALLALLGFGWLGLQEQQKDEQQKRISDPTRSIVEITEDIAKENEAFLRDRYRDEFNEATAEIDSSGSVDSVRLVIKRYDDMTPEHRKLVAAELEQLTRHAKQREEQLLYQQFADCKRLKNSDCVPIITKYLAEFPDGPHADEVRGELTNIKEAEYLTARGQIKRISTTTAKGLKQRADAITRLLQQHDDWIDEYEKVRISRARDWAFKLLEPRQYHCTLVRTSEMDTPRDHGVEVFVDQDRLVNYTDSGDVTEKNWDRDFTIRWKAGQNISVKLVNYDGRNQDMAYFTNNSPVAIVLLAGANEPSRYATTAKWGGTDFTATRPRFRVEFKCEEISDNLLPIIADYLVPGDKW